MRLRGYTRRCLRLLRTPASIKESFDVFVSNLRCGQRAAHHASGLLPCATHLAITYSPIGQLCLPFTYQSSTYLMMLWVTDTGVSEGLILVISSKTSIFCRLFITLLRIHLFRMLTCGILAGLKSKALSNHLISYTHIWPWLDS